MTAPKQRWRDPQEWRQVWRYATGNDEGHLRLACSDSWQVVEDLFGSSETFLDTAEVELTRMGFWRHISHVVVAAYHTRNIAVHKSKIDSTLAQTCVLTWATITRLVDGYDPLLPALDGALGAWGLEGVPHSRDRCEQKYGSLKARVKKMTRKGGDVDDATFLLFWRVCVRLARTDPDGELVDLESRLGLTRRALETPSTGGSDPQPQDKPKPNSFFISDPFKDRKSSPTSPPPADPNPLAGPFTEPQDDPPPSSPPKPVPPPVDAPPRPDRDRADRPQPAAGTTPGQSRGPGDQEAAVSGGKGGSPPPPPAPAQRGAPNYEPDDELRPKGADPLLVLGMIGIACAGILVVVLGLGGLYLLVAVQSDPNIPGPPHGPPPPPPRPPPPPPPPEPPPPPIAIWAPAPVVAARPAPPVQEPEVSPTPPTAPPASPVDIAAASGTVVFQGLAPSDEISLVLQRGGADATSISLSGADGPAFDLPIGLYSATISRHARKFSGTVSCKFRVVPGESVKIQVPGDDRKRWEDGRCGG